LTIRITARLFWNRLPIEAKFRIGEECLGCENMDKRKKVAKRNNFRIKHDSVPKSSDFCIF
jgi:hypothetical protein